MEINEVFKEHNDKINKKTCTIKEFAEMLGVSEKKARSISRISGCPLISIGRNKRILLNKVDEFLETLIGEEIN